VPKTVLHEIRCPGRFLLLLWQVATSLHAAFGVLEHNNKNNKPLAQLAQTSGVVRGIAQRVRVLVNFVDPGSIPSGSHFATTHTLATEGVAHHRLFPTQGGFRIRDLPGSLCQARSERACA